MRDLGERVVLVREGVYHQPSGHAVVSSCSMCVRGLRTDLWSCREIGPSWLWCIGLGVDLESGGAIIAPARLCQAAKTLCCSVVVWLGGLLRSPRCSLRTATESKF